MAVIRVHDIPLEVRLGALPEEQVSPQTVRLDVEVDTAVSGGSDRLDDTVNYIDIVEATRGAARARAYHLVETLAGAIIDQVSAISGVTSVRVRVRKFHLPRMGEVGYVEIEQASR